MSQDFNKSLNLPKTSFSMKADLVSKEPALIAKWGEEHYKNIQEFLKNRPEFTLYDGPPYANGSIHIGHAVNKLIKDFIIRSKILDGFKVDMTPGWDCHGLPIELYVEKLILNNIDSNADTTSSWQALCRRHAQTQVELQSSDFKRLGIFAKWHMPYTTMDFTFEAEIIRTLGKVWQDGYLKQELKPVNWCTVCESSLAESEVIPVLREYDSIYFSFKIENVELLEERIGKPLDENTYLVVWTTTPWTISENAAVAINVNITYVYIRFKNFFIIVSKTCFEFFKTSTNDIFDGASIIEILQGQHLLALSLKHPFINKSVSVYDGDFVSDNPPTTGIVHISPSHGIDDFLLSKKYGISCYTSVTKNGTYSSANPIFYGEHIFNIADKVIAILKENNALIYTSKEQHLYPHCWRHKTPLIFLATPQWFINLQYKDLSKDIENQIKHISTYPAWGTSLLSKMTTGRGEWCISRQRKWGVPLPLFTHKITGDIHPNTINIFKDVAELVEQNGIESFLNKTNVINALSDGEYYSCPNDVLDVWFDSGCVPLVLQKDKKQFMPVDLIVEGIDQFRGWYQSTVILSNICHKTNPYKHIITHGFVVDKENRKMSKSIGNVISPHDIVSKYGADVLRLYVASMDYTSDMVISEDLIDIAADKYRKIRNTFRFLLAAIEDFDIDNCKPSILLEIDKYILEKAAQVQEKVRQFYDQYEVHRAIQEIFYFCVKDLSNFYINIIKDRQYTSPKTSNEFISIQITCYHLVQIMLRAFTTVLPFTCQEILGHINKFKTVQLETDILHLQWYTALPRITEDQFFNCDFWERMNIIYNQLNQSFESEKALNNISPQKKLQDCRIIIRTSEYMFIRLNKMANELRFFFNCGEVCLSYSELDLNKLDTIEKIIEISQTLYKCPRCWNKEQYLNNEGICLRCEDNLSIEPKIKKLYF